VIDGLEKARRSGKKLGRPRIKLDLQKVRELREQGMSIRQIDNELGVSHSTVLRALKGGTKTSPRGVYKEKGKK